MGSNYYIMIKYMIGNYQ